MTADLEGRDLDVKLAEALGWRRHARIGDGTRGWHPTSECIDSQGRLAFACQLAPIPEKETERSTILIPDWHASLDAIMRDIWPVLRERNFDIDIKLLHRDDSEAIVLKCGPDETGNGYSIEPVAVEHDDPLALALARACLKALEEPS